MEQNPFASFNIEIPKQYAELVKKYCKTGSNQDSFEHAPFERQVDIWYFAFIYALKKGLSPKQEKDTSNITPASILSNDSYRISHIQLAFIGYNKSIDDLANHRKVFNFALDMANAGLPYVLNIIKNDDQRPIWNCLDEIEECAG
jgi:hypothetical protein